MLLVAEGRLRIEPEKKGAAKPEEWVEAMQMSKVGQRHAPNLCTHENLPILRSCFNCLGHRQPHHRTAGLRRGRRGQLDIPFAKCAAAAQVEAVGAEAGDYGWSGLFCGRDDVAREVRQPPLPRLLLTICCALPTAR